MAFLEWLAELGGNVVLVAHKCLDYDAKVKANVQGVCFLTGAPLNSLSKNLFTISCT